MYIPILVLITILSLTPIGDKISGYIVKKRTVISKFLLVLSFSTLLLLFSEVTVHKTGELSLWLLWIVLWLPILSKVFSLNIASKLMLFRKELGIWMGIMAFVHSVQYFLKPNAIMLWDIEFWYSTELVSYLGIGFIATTITMFLLFSSNDFIQKKLGKKWKYLQKTAYLVLILTLLHVALIKFSKTYEDLTIVEAFVISFIPFVFYLIGKIFEWNKIKIMLNFGKLIIIGLLTLIIVISYNLLNNNNGTNDIIETSDEEIDQLILEEPVVKIVEPAEDIVEQPEQIIEQPEQDKKEEEQEKEQLNTNVSSIVEKCDSLCGEDAENYCTEMNEVIFSEDKITFGTCRSLSKYNKIFHRCQGFCTQYGKEKKTSSGCQLPNGQPDINCDGN